MSDAARRSAQAILVVGLRDAHAMERHAVVVLEGQLRGLQAFPDFHARVAEHAQESRGQARRLEDMLARLDAAPSTLKDLTLSAMGFAEAAVTQAAGDAPVKALLALSMFEHLEIAAYRALLEMADLAGVAELSADLQSSLLEEEAMSDWLSAHLPEVTRRFVSLSGGAEASGAPASDAPGAVSAGGDAPLRDLAEFTDPAPDPAKADWPGGGDGAPAEDAGRDDGAGPLRDLAEFTDPAPDPKAADWPPAEDGALERPSGHGVLERPSGT